MFFLRLILISLLYLTFSCSKDRGKPDIIFNKKIQAEYIPGDTIWFDISIKDNIQLKESFLVDLNTGGSFVYDFDLVWEIKKVYLKYFLTPKYALVAFKKVIKDFKFLKP